MATEPATWRRARIQALGGYGYTHESWLEDQGDVRNHTRSTEGTSEIMEMTIAVDPGSLHLKTAAALPRQHVNSTLHLPIQRGRETVARLWLCRAGRGHGKRPVRSTHPSPAYFCCALATDCLCRVAGSLARRAARMAEASSTKSKHPFDANALAALGRISRVRRRSR